MVCDKMSLVPFESQGGGSFYRVEEKSKKTRRTAKAACECPGQRLLLRGDNISAGYEANIKVVSNDGEEEVNERGRDFDA